MLLYDNMRFDLLLVSDQYEYQGQRARLRSAARYRAGLAHGPQAHRSIRRRQMEGRSRRGVARSVRDRLRPGQRHFRARQHRAAAQRARPARHILVDGARPIFGPLATGRVVEIGDRAMTIGGQYVLGTGFMGLGVAWPARRISPGCLRAAGRPGQSRPDPAGSRRRPRASGRGSPARSPAPARTSSPSLTPAATKPLPPPPPPLGLVFGSGLLISVVVGGVVGPDRLGPGQPESPNSPP